MPMTKERYIELSRDYSLSLTEEEISEGWHFCMDWDGLLINKDGSEAEVCTCLPKNT